jgi:hypothetical protein
MKRPQLNMRRQVAIQKNPGKIYKTGDWAPECLKKQALWSKGPFLLTWRRDNQHERAAQQSLIPD